MSDKTVIRYWSVSALNGYALRTAKQTGHDAMQLLHAIRWRLDSREREELPIEVLDDCVGATISRLLEMRAALRAAITTETYAPAAGEGCYPPNPAPACSPELCQGENTCLHQ